MAVADAAWAVAHDPDVRLLLLYLENIANPELLAQTAAYARERDLPIVAVKAGRMGGGARPGGRSVFHQRAGSRRGVCRGSLRIAPLFAGVRGEPAWDIEALAAVAVDVGRLIRAGQGSLASIDLNPVMIGAVDAVDAGALVVDALVERG